MVTFPGNHGDSPNRPQFCVEEGESWRGEGVMGRGMEWRGGMKWGGGIDWGGECGECVGGDTEWRYEHQFLS